MSEAARALHWRVQNVSSYFDRSGQPWNSLRDWDRSLQLFSVNEEFLVSTISSECADYVPVLCTHRPSLLPIECFSEIFGLVFRAALGSFGLYRKDAQTGSFRGSKSRNKVFVGEPAYGSLPLRDCSPIMSTTPLTSRSRMHASSSPAACACWLCRTTMSLGKCHGASASAALALQPFHSQQIIVVCPLNMNRISTIHRHKQKIILYGGSLGSLFDEERSKVRESNANCRTHWAWITRTHLAAEALAEAKFASVLFT